MGLFDDIRKAAESFSDEAKKKVEQAVTDASGLAGKVKESASESLGQLGDTVSAVSQKVEQAVTDAGELAGKVKESASESLGQFGDKVSAVSQKVCESAVDLGDWARKVPETVTEYTGEFEPGKFWDKVKNWAADMGQEVVFMGVAIFYLVAEILGFEHNDEHKEKK